MLERLKEIGGVFFSRVGLFLLLVMILATSAGYVLIRLTHPELTRKKISTHPVLERYGSEITYVDEAIVERKFRVLADKPAKFFESAEGKVLTAGFFFDLARIRPRESLFRLSLDFLGDAQSQGYDLNKVLSLRYEILHELLKRKMGHHLVVAELESMMRDPGLKDRLLRDAEYHRLQAHRYSVEENDEEAEKEIELYFDLRRTRGGTARRLAKFEVARIRFDLVRQTLRAELRDRLASIPSEPDRMVKVVERLKRVENDLSVVVAEDEDGETFRREYPDIWYHALFMIARGRLMQSKIKMDAGDGSRKFVLSPSERKVALSDAARSFTVIKDSPLGSDWVSQCRLFRAEAQLLLGRKVRPALIQLESLQKYIMNPELAFAAYIISAEWLMGERRNKEALKALRTARDLHVKYPDAALEYRDEIDLEAAFRRVVEGLLAEAKELAARDRKLEEIDPLYNDAIAVYGEIRDLPQVKNVPAVQIKYLFLEGEVRERLAEMLKKYDMDRSKESWVEAARCFDSIIRTAALRRELRMNEREALHRRTAADYRRGDFNPGAIVVYLQHLKFFPDSPYRGVVLKDIARTHYDLHDVEGAIKYYERNIEEFSAKEGRPEGKNIPETRFELAQVLLRRNRPEKKEGEKVVEPSDRDKAIQLFESLLRHPVVDPRSSLWKSALYSCGFELIKAGRREAGEKKLEIALERFGTDMLAFDAIELLGGQLFDDKDYRRAREIYQKAEYVDVKPGDGLPYEKKLFARFSVGNCLLKEGKYSEAVAVYEQTAREAGDRLVTVWAYVQIGAAYDYLAKETVDVAQKRDFLRRAENARALGERKLQKLGDEAFQDYPKTLDRKFHEDMLKLKNPFSGIGAGKGP